MITLAGGSIAAAGLLVDVVTAMFFHFGPVGTPPEPNCNNRSLTPAGEALINALIDHKMMIEVDHSDRRTFDRILDIAEARHYPGIVAGHTGFTGATTSDPDSEKTGRHEATKTDVMVQRIVNVGGFLSVIPHQGGRSRIQDLSSAYGVPFDCGNSSQTWAQIYLYATQNLGVPAIGIGSDFNGFAEWVAPRTGPNACAGDHDASYAPNLNTLVESRYRCWTTTAIRCRNTRSATEPGTTTSMAWHTWGSIPTSSRTFRPRASATSWVRCSTRPRRTVKMWEKIDDVDAPTVQCGTVGASWHASDVSVPCNAYNVGWGLQNGSDASFVYRDVRAVRNPRRAPPPPARIRRFATPAAIARR